MLARIECRHRRWYCPGRTLEEHGELGDVQGRGLSTASCIVVDGVAFVEVF